MTSYRKALALCLMIAGPFTSGPLMAQGQGTLKGKVTSVVVRKRSDAPMMLQAEFEYRGRGLLEGNAELTFVQYNRVLGVVRSADLTLSAGNQTFRLMVPPVHGAPGDAQTSVRMRFVAGGSTFDLGECPLRVTDPNERGLLICVGEALEGGEPVETAEVTGGTEPAPTRFSIAQALRVERFKPERPPVYASLDGGTRAVPALPLATGSAFVQCEDFAAHPLGYCPYDLVFLAGDAFAPLRERQLDALQRWVEAGGSVCIMPARGLKDHHLRFLNALAAQPGESGPRFALTAEGAVVNADGRAATGISLFRSELGRTAVVFSPVTGKEDLNTPEWRGMVAFLWKMRFDRIASAVHGGSWLTAAERAPGLAPPVYGSGAFSARANPAGQGLVYALMPTSVRIVPLGLIALMLCGFIAVIGPLDYFLLGALKLRKLTWVLLPGACFGFTVAMVLMASHYMGRSDQRTAMVFCDVGQGGRVLRANRCELIFAAGQTKLTTRVENALFSDLTHGPTFGANEEGPYGGPMGRGDVHGNVLAYQGRLPSAYSVVQEIMQWRPQLNRALSISPAQSAADFHWDAVTTPMLRDPQRWGEAKVALLAGRERGFKGSAIVCRGQEAYTLYGDPNRVIRADPNAWQQEQIRRVYIAPPVMPPGVTSSYRGPAIPTLVPPPGFQPQAGAAGAAGGMLSGISAPPQDGLFSILYQIAPTGGNNFEDFAVLDPTDPNQWLLVVVSPEPEGTVVYRRLYWDR